MTFDDQDTAAERHEARIRNCRSCQKRIVFLENPASGKSVPVDEDTVEENDDAFDSSRHVSHFTTCDKPEKFSRKR